MVVTVSWINNYLCNQCLSLLMWWGVLSTTLCDKVCQWLASGRWFSPGTPVSSTNKTDRHVITEILLKTASLNTITPYFLHFGPLLKRSHCGSTLLQKFNVFFLTFISVLLFHLVELFLRRRLKMWKINWRQMTCDTKI
jgi:hypothetical protein